MINLSSDRVLLSSNFKVNLEVNLCKESVKRSVRGLISLAVNKPIHIPEDRRRIPTEELIAEWEQMTFLFQIFGFFSI